MLSIVSILLLKQFMVASNFDSRKANHTSLSIKSIALLHFALKPSIERIEVSFLINS